MSKAKFAKCSIVGEDNGWLLQNGNFYRCPFAQHEKLNEWLIKKGITRKESHDFGIVKLTAGIVVFYDGLNLNWRIKITQKQIDKLFDYTKGSFELKQSVEINGYSFKSFKDFITYLEDKDGDAIMLKIEGKIK